MTIEATVTIPQGGAGAGPPSTRSGGTVGGVQDKCAFSLLLLRPVDVQKIGPRIFKYRIIYLRFNFICLSSPSPKSVLVDPLPDFLENTFLAFFR